jgi:hypothetical protein
MIVEQQVPVANEHGLPNKPPLTRASCFSAVLQREDTAAGCRETHDIHADPCKRKLVGAWSGPQMMMWSGRTLTQMKSL